MASTSSSRHAKCEHIDVAGQVCEVNALGEECESPLSEPIEGSPHVVSPTTAMVPSSRLQSLATWLLGFYRYICTILGYLATYSPSTQVDQHEIASETSIGVNPRRGVPSVDGINIQADREYSLESKHKIFLSHSGSQKDFVEQLCVDLERCDRYPFFDKLQSSLPIGEKFPKLIFDAIEQCQVGVVVLSEEFFMRSKWPMLELNAMVKEFGKPCPRITIIPVFYLISLNALKDPKNHRQWVSKWEEWACKDKCVNVEEWMGALRTVGSTNSLVMKEGGGDVKFREEIVREVCELVGCETRWDDSHVQGRLRTCKVICEKMDQLSASSGVCVVGLYGMGGIGKTTICKALCNDLSQKFHDNVCHVELGHGSEMELLQRALKKLTSVRHDIVDKLDDMEQGFSYLKTKVLTQPVFLALDNVQDNHKSMDEARTYVKASYGGGSIVLVTARSLDVLKNLNLDEKNCLEMPELEEGEARSLFLKCTELPSGNEVDGVLIKKCIERCHFVKGDGKSRHYHPLALEVLGRQLGSNSTQWAAQLSKIDTFNLLQDTEHPVFSVLRISFDSLKHVHQLVFMEVALGLRENKSWPFPDYWNSFDWLCMVHDESVEDMKDMLKVLKRKSLLENLNGGFTISVHDLWREFAVAETQSEVFRDRQWVYQEDGRRRLGRSGRRWENVERMCFFNWGWKGLNGLKLDEFVNVAAFQLEVEILMRDCVLDLDLSGLKHLKSLEVCSSGLTVRADGLRSLTNLGFLVWSTRGFSPCFDEIGRLTNLQVLFLRDCKGAEVLDLTELKLLRVVGIKQLPNLITVRGLGSGLANLRSLWICGCESLRECPGLGELYALEELVLLKCGKLDDLPWLGRLTNLRVLLSQNCVSLRGVPGLSDLVALEELIIEECSKLAILPDIGKLTKLRRLEIEGCPVQGVPGLDGLIALTSLYASFGKVLGGQPVFPKLSVLKTVWIEGWNGPVWTSIRNLLMLEVLFLDNCKGEDMDVSDLQNLKRLKSVALCYCEVRDLSGLSNSTALEILKVDRCDKLERLPEFERLTKLGELGIYGCDDLRNWPSASNLCSLQCLTADGFSLMKIGPDLETLTGLRELRLWGRRGDENALCMASLLQVQRLRIKYFSTTETLDLSNFPRLKELELYDCGVLKSLTCSISLTAMFELKVTECGSLVEMPDLSRFPQLEKLSLKNCRALRRLTCSRPVIAMKKIKLVGCDRRVEMPDLINKFPKLMVFSQKEELDSVG